MPHIADSLLYVTMTVTIFCLARLAQRRVRTILFNPLLVTMVAIIIILKLRGVTYEAYSQGGQYIDFWLKPAVVALGLPLYRQLNQIKSQWRIVLIAELCGCVAGIVSVVWIARLCGASEVICLSLAAKSVTTPIAIEVTSSLGGIPALTAAIVISVGVFGSIIGYGLMRACGVRNPMSMSLAMGTAAHAVGTAHSSTISDRFSAYSGLGLIVNGVMTALLAPLIVPII